MLPRFASTFSKTRVARDSKPPQKTTKPANLKNIKDGNQVRTHTRLLEHETDWASSKENSYSNSQKLS